MFANILNTEKFSKLSKTEQYFFYLEKNIYVSGFEYWRNSNAFTYALKRAKKEQKALFYILHHFSDKLLKEVIQTFNKQFIEPDIFAVTEKIKIQVSTMLDTESVTKYLTKTHKKHSKKLNKNSTYFWYCLSNEGLNKYGCKDFEHHFMHEISEEIVMEYLLNESVNFYADKSFKELIEIKEELAILNYIESLKLEIENASTRKVNFASKKKELTLTQQLFLLEEIRNTDINIWDNIPKTKKAHLLSLLFGKNSENIRKNLGILDKSKSKLTNRQNSDLEHIQSILNNTLG